MTNYKLHKVLCVYADTGGSGSGNQGNDYKLVKAIKNGVEYEFGGGVDVSPTIRLLVAAGGGGGGGNYGGGGGAGGMFLCDVYSVTSGCSYNITVGAGGGARTNGGNSTFGSITMYGGGAGGCGCSSSNKGCNGGSGGGTGSGSATSSAQDGGTPCCILYGSPGGRGGPSTYSWGTGGGGGGAGGCGAHGGSSCFNNTTCCSFDGWGGKGIYTDICGEGAWYAGGGGGSNSGGSGATTGGCGRDNCGGGGAGNSGSGKCGIIIIAYKSDGSSGITCATGGNCCYECNGYCIHKFTSDGTFCVNPTNNGGGSGGSIPAEPL